MNELKKAAQLILAIPVMIMSFWIVGGLFVITWNEGGYQKRYEKATKSTFIQKEKIFFKKKSLLTKIFHLPSKKQKENHKEAKNV
jgi:hypothetical protein